MTETIIDWDSLIDKYRQLEVDNKRLKEENRWIPVEERLPKNVCDVWISGPTSIGGCWTDVGFYGDKIWTRYGCGLNKRVTHWKPIISPAEQALKGDM